MAPAPGRHVAIASAPVTWPEVYAAAAGPATIRLGPAEALDRLERLRDVASPLLSASGAVIPPES